VIIARVGQEIDYQSRKDMMLNMLARGHGTKSLVCVGAAILVLVGGCSAARSVPHPVSHAGHFGPFPTPPITDGSVKYMPLFGPDTGSGSKVFTIPARTRYIVWLACLGSGGSAEFKSAAPGPDPDVSCGSKGTVSGYDVDVTRALIGHETTMRIIAPRAAKWELRIDGAQNSNLGLCSHPRSFGIKILI
jgi:hypothetical protein